MDNETLDFMQARLELDSINEYITATIACIEQDYTIPKTGDGLDECLMYLKSAPEIIAHLQQFLLQCEQDINTNKGL